MSKINLDTFDLTQLPDAEDDVFEFKSSLTSEKELKKKLNCAVSGFANAGGGYFIAGIDGNGNANGGLPLSIVGRQYLRDWADQAVNEVKPAPKYEIKLIQDSAGRGTIQPDCAVLVVAVHESYTPPHMAHDGRYYIRAGAHTVQASHFIIEALWAKRHFSKPRLTHLFRLKPGKEQAIQLGVLALTDAPAIDVKITLSPLPQMIQHCESLFPLRSSVVDRNNPFFFDVTTYYEATERFGEDVNLEIEYCDLAGNHYSYSERLEIAGTVTPINIGNDHFEKMAKTLEAMSKTLSSLTVSRESPMRSSLASAKSSEDDFAKLEEQIPELLAEMRTDLLEHSFSREIIIKHREAIYNGRPEEVTLEYHFETHSYLRSKLRILENYGLVHNITFNDVPRFVISEELATYLTRSSEE